MFIKITLDSDHTGHVYVVPHAHTATFQQSHEAVATVDQFDQNTIRRCIAAIRKAVGDYILPMYEFVVIHNGDNRWQLSIQKSWPWPGKASYYAGMIAAERRRWKKPKQSAYRSHRYTGHYNSIPGDVAARDSF